LCKDLQVKERLKRYLGYFLIAYFAIGILYFIILMASDIPRSIHDAFNPKKTETTCQTLLRTMKPSDEGYDAMIDSCLSGQDG
jgi:hypothetical protein